VLLAREGNCDAQCPETALLPDKAYLPTHHHMLTPHPHTHYSFFATPHTIPAQSSELTHQGYHYERLSSGVTTPPTFC
jgi:hypothetical protein